MAGMKSFCRLLVAVSLGFLAAVTSAAEKRVVLIVWDGMRPDFVSAEQTPELFRLAQSGVTFAAHHSVYPTSTEVNGTALATGVYPNRSGIMANREYRPEIEPLKSVETQDFSAMQKGDAISHGGYLGVPTIAETVQAAGFRTVVAGAKAVAVLHDRSGKRDAGAAAKSVTLFAGRTLPAAAVEPIAASLGVFPLEQDFPALAHNTWTTRALVEHLWKDDVSKFTLLWFSEPDFSQHRAGPGSALAIAALKGSDANLAIVLAALEARDLRESTDILVVSDHGFSTVSRSVDVPALLKSAGFAAFREFLTPPKAGDILVVGNGGTVLFYVIGHDAEVTRRLVEFLQRSDFAGVIFSQVQVEGTFPLSRVRIDTASAPDVVMAFRWSEEINDAGKEGMLVADWNRKAKQGTHASLSRYDVHNTLIAAGPDFKRGWTDQSPSGNVDVAPTILSILGIPPLEKMDGRILAEAMPTKEPAGKAEPRRTETTRSLGGVKWQQFLEETRMGPSIYLDDGNGSAMPN
ncbi:MAG: hypothetical protein QOD99_1991 [Chthoniobacter sp.]|jgi:arylsulfatase A-like enzyme|nr:hypothetical protein [Chthoniobacter sp.]